MAKDPEEQETAETTTDGAESSETSTGDGEGTSESESGTES